MSYYAQSPRGVYPTAGSTPARAPNDNNEHDRSASAENNLKRKNDSRGPGRSKQPKIVSDAPPILYNQIWVENYKMKLPEELVSQCHPLSCDLCGVKVNSAVQAKMHYEGKLHEKKTKNFMTIWAKEHNQAIPEFNSAPPVVPPPTSKAKEAWPVTLANQTLRCNICNVGFNSEMHAGQHFAGKNHAKKLKQAQNIGAVPPTGPAATPMAPGLPLVVPAKPPAPPVGQFVCELCNVNAVSQIQLDSHLQGKPHRIKMEKLKKLSMSLDDANATPLAPGAKKDNYSIYRTPSGQYYCSLCNIAVDSEHQFGQHLESKKHKSKQKPTDPKMENKQN